MSQPAPAQVLIARKEIGTVEKPAGSNKQKYGEWYGFNGVAWCAIFVSWCMAKAGLGNHYRFASVAASVAWAKKNGKWHPNNGRVTPKPGWVACRLYTKTKGHTAIVEAAEGNDVTIEGNTSHADDRNGGIVMRRRRARSFWTGWIEVPTGVVPDEEEDMPAAYAVVCEAGEPDEAGNYPHTFTAVPLPVLGALGGRWRGGYLSFANDFGPVTLRLAFGMDGKVVKVIDDYEVQKGPRRMGFDLADLGQVQMVSVLNKGPHDVTAWVEAF